MAVKAHAQSVGRGEAETEPQAPPGAVPMAHAGAQPGVRAWLRLAIGSLVVAGCFAFLTAMTRTPAVQLLATSQAFYTALVTHVTFALTVWLLAALAVTALVVGWLASGSTPGRLARLGAALAMVGAAAMASAGALGLGQPYLNDFVPVLDHPVFYSGLLLFGAGVTVVTIWFLTTYPRWRRLSAEAFGVALAGLALLVALALLLDTARRLPDDGMGRETTLRVLFWASGQGLLFADTILMAAVWLLLLRFGYGRLRFAEHWARAALFAYTPFLFGVAALFTSGEPAHLFGAARGLVNAVTGVGLALPSMALVALALTQIGRGPRPWREPWFAALALSLALYLAGGLIAVAGFRSDLRVPAHYHGTVGAVTMALMGLLPALVPGAPRWPRLARVQPYLYGGGLLLMMLGLYWAGLLGAPRKTFGFDWAGLPALLALNLMGLGAGLAVLGGALFVVLALPPLLPSLRALSRSAAALQPGAQRYAAPDACRCGSDGAEAVTIGQTLSEHGYGR